MSQVDLPSVSVLIPFYGNFDIARARLSVESVASQQQLDLQVVISESGPSPRLRLLAEQIDAVYCFCPVKERAAIFSPGRIRNAGLLACGGDIVYTNDADIVFQNRQYLHSLVVWMREHNLVAMRWPPMRRLPIACFPTFSQMSQEYGLTTALGMLQRPNKYLAFAGDVQYKLKVRRRPGVLEDYNDGLVFTCTEEDYAQYVDDPSLRGLEPIVFHQVRHIGGIFARRDQLIAVGGYSENFLVWGNEDTDIQWKIADVFQLDYVPDFERFEVLHLDHVKGYFCPKQWQRNKALQAARWARRVDDIVEEDKAAFSAHSNVDGGS